jgi:carboxypeptidase C (cathepsin A)
LVVIKIRFFSYVLGFMTEQGPFRPNADMTLSLNEFAWNTVANMVFIESPAGVGFSYSSDPTKDYTTGDAQTAQDNYNLIQAFMTRFPEYSTNSLYISSESYGGHYMPTLAKQIVDSNKLAGANVLNFKGFAVGNPYTDHYSGTPAMFDTFWGHQLIAKPTYDSYYKSCVLAKKPNAKACARLEAKMNKQVGNLNPYALDYPVCTADNVARKGRAQRTWLLNQIMYDRSKEDRALLGVMSTEEYEPCADDYADTYLNQDSVKAAIHVNSDIKWESCSYKIQYNMSDSRVSTAPIYNYLVDGGYKLDILVYSGDDDSVCGTVGTQSWIWDLGYTADNSNTWKTYTYNQQVAGYLTQWTNTKLAFLTVHNAGHEVPTYVPDVALDLWTKYLQGEFTNV